MDHPFVDGKKRVAFFVTDVFLRMNGWYLDIDDDEAIRFSSDSLKTTDATSIL